MQVLGTKLLSRHVFENYKFDQGVCSIYKCSKNRKLN